MNIQLYQIAHIFAVVMLTAVVFGALAAPHPEHRKRAMMWSGILALSRWSRALVFWRKAGSVSQDGSSSSWPAGLASPRFRVWRSGSRVKPVRYGYSR